MYKRSIASVRLDRTAMVVGPIGDLGDTIHALIGGISQQDRQQIQFMGPTFGVGTQHMFKTINEACVPIHHAQYIGNRGRRYL